MFDFLIVGYRHFFVFLYEHVGLALAILLTSVISSFMIYWTLNNFFTCLKTLAEDRYSGAHLLWGRVKWFIQGEFVISGLSKIKRIDLKNKGIQEYATFAFVCIVLAIHSYLVLIGKYGGTLKSGKCAAYICC